MIGQTARANPCCAQLIQTTLPKSLGQPKCLKIRLNYRAEHRAEGPDPAPGPSAQGWVNDAG